MDNNVQNTTPNPTASPVSNINHSRNKYILMAAAAILLVLLIGGFYLHQNSNKPAPVKTAYQPSASPTLTPTPVSDIKTVGSSNQDLDQDMQAVNSSYTNLNTDNTSVDQSLNDQATNLQ